MSRQSENYRDEACPGSTKQRHDAGSLFRGERWVVGQKLLDPFSKRTDMPSPTRCDGRCMISAPVPTDPGAMNVARMKIRLGRVPARRLRLRRYTPSIERHRYSRSVSRLFILR